MNTQSKLEATVEGYLIGFEFDNNAEVIEKSLVIEILKDIQSQLIEIKRNESGGMYRVNVGGRLGHTSTSIPFSSGVFPVWFDNSQTVDFVNKSKVEFIK